LFSSQVHREKELNRSFNGFGDGNHDISSIDPENIIEKETPKQDKSDLEIRQDQAFDTADAESDTKEIVKEPMLGQEVSDGGGNSDKTSNDFTSVDRNVKSSGVDLEVELEFLLENVDLAPFRNESFNVVAKKLDKTQETKDGEVE